MSRRRPWTLEIDLLRFLKPRPLLTPSTPPGSGPSALSPLHGLAAAICRACSSPAVAGKLGEGARTDQPLSSTPPRPQLCAKPRGCTEGKRWPCVGRWGGALKVSGSWVRCKDSTRCQRAFQLRNPYACDAGGQVRGCRGAAFSRPLGKSHFCSHQKLTPLVPDSSPPCSSGEVKASRLLRVFQRLEKPGCGEGPRG